MDGVSWSQLELPVAGSTGTWARIDLRVESANLIAWRCEVIDRDAKTIALTSTRWHDVAILESLVDQEIQTLLRLIEKRTSPF